MEADLVLCSGNPGKVEELRALLPGRFRLIGLADLGLPKDLPEDGATLYANAEQKARYVYDRCGLPCIADDSGLEVDALGGAPGVFSARYAGSPSNAEANMRKLLAAMEGMADRRARFRTVICHIDAGGATFFEGTVEGTITTTPRGTGGFGYDPVFLPEMSDLTFAELDARRKNAISHRGKAVWKLVSWLSDHQLSR